MKRRLWCLVLMCAVLSAWAVPVTLTPSDSKAVKESVSLLEEYLEKSTGEKPVVAASAAEGLNIRLEVRPAMSNEPETFVLEFPSKNQVVIAGGTPLAVRHGTCEFLERFYGIRWLYGGKDGDYVPKVTRTPEFPTNPIRESPAYKLRTFALTHGRKSEYTWAARNKGIFNYDFWKFPGYTWFHHNMHRLLPVEKYGTTHPEFFPIRDGKRLIPEKGENIYWQYCFSAPGIADELVSVIQQGFKKGNSTSASFGVNDGARYCECERCRALDGNRKNRIGFEDNSRSYLTCINQVAEKCAAPGRTFGFLAYGNVLEPPEGMKIHPSLIPFFTYDLMYWADPARAAFSQSVTQNWVKSNGSKVGWYDYLEHRWFLIPKISLNVIPEALRWGAANGVIHYYAEAYPTEDWHTGPMLWLVLKLTWNPNQDVNALLDDWCRAAVGEKAAPFLKQWYQGCSDFWEKEVPKTEFFKDTERRQYLGASSGYLAAVEIEWFDKMKECLNQTVQLATPECKERAKAIQKTFLDREKMIRTYAKNNKLRKEAASLRFKTLRNFDFNRPGTWSTWQRNTSKGTFSYAATEGMNGTGAQAMDLAKSYRNMVFMTSLKAEPKRIYRVTANVRTQGVDGTATASLSIAWSAPGKPWLDNSFNVSDSLVEDGSFTWRKLNVVVAAPDVPGCAMRIMLGGDKSSKGILYWDEVKVEQAESVE